MQRIVVADEGRSLVDFLEVPLLSGDIAGIRAADVAVLQRGPGGSSALALATGQVLELALTYEAAGSLIPTVWFVADGIRLNPNHILYLAQRDGEVEYHLHGNIVARHTGATIAMINKFLEEGRQNRVAEGLPV